MITLSGLNLFLDSLEEGILFLDRRRHVVAINQAAKNILGREEDQVIDRLCPSLFQGTACARNCEQGGGCKLMSKASGEKIVQDLAVARPDGEPLPLRMWAMRLTAEAGLAHYAVILRDRSQEVRLSEAASERLQLGGLVGHGAAMQELFRHILRAAASEASVLISGESGTGKELVARALHDNSSRSGGPYLRVHCAAFPEHLLEAELFGHARGAFTGATAAREGRFEAAHGGTLLLDEIGEVPPSVQVKLLRVLQEREIERLGENRTRKVDVRILAATHRDLAVMVRDGEFRADLYYRLRVLPLRVPALRERREDIPLLTDALLANLSRRHPGAMAELAPETLACLTRYAWPGNVRELANALEYALVHVDGTLIQPRHLPPEILNSAQEVPDVQTRGPGTTIQPSARNYYRAPVESGEQEREILARTLRESAGNRAEAARRLGMSRTTLWKKMKQYAFGLETGK
ncbi:MAG: sigma 54-interacting transcriptional regulator [Hydrogenophilales bacterium]|nr:sigma 54-interacting transcriptional regulator [Hydrogenophilales bacterium]